MSQGVNAARAPIATVVLWYWFPVVMMFGLMYWFSTDVFSSDNTRSVLERIYLWFNPHATRHSINSFNYFVRKSAHFTEYAVLGGLLYRAFRAGDPVKWRLRWAACSFAFSLTWALLDEFHQSLTRTRGASIWDSLLDTTGALFILTMIALFARITRLRSAAAK
jgi:VanZ family protein